MEAITDVRDISRIAYGFKAAKALFVAIQLDIFGRLSPAPKTLERLCGETGIARNRLDTFLTALVGLGLLSKEGDEYANAPACDNYLVPGKPAYFGDYFRHQTDRQIFPAYCELEAVIRGQRTGAAFGAYETLMNDANQAREFSRGQHMGSLGPANLLAKKVDLASRRTLLDVGGGSGAFTITLCRHNPDLAATILDFPNALDVARGFTAEAGLDGRIRFAGGDAMKVDWPGGNDVVLMSYLFSAASPDAILEFCRRAYDALTPGGLLIVHDFMVDDDGGGPQIAALWLLTCMFNCADAVALTPKFVTNLIAAAGFADIAVDQLIPETTRYVLAYKPS